MATPVSNNVPLIGDGRVDGLVQGSSWTFGGGPRTLTYSFTTAFDIEGEAAPAWDNRWTSAVTNAFNTWAAVANIRFSRVEGIGTGPQNESTADIAISLEPGDFGLAGLGVFPSPAFGSELLDALGYSRNSGEFPYPRIEGDIAYFPQATGFAGGAIFNVNGTLDKLQAGGMGFAILMHEIAHALGLKHAFDDGGNGRPTFDGLGLPAGFQYTLMGGESYEADPNSKIFPATPMLYDILAIQRIYGANNSYNTGDSTYQLFNDTVYRLIWDAGGTDTLTAAALSAAMTINLNAGEFSGPTSDWTKRVGTAFNVSIENATGGSGSDTITGNALANVLQGGGGDDTLRGGSGNDTLHGGAGSNTLEGGDGNDTYVLATGSANEVVEGAGAGSGIDTVQAPMHYVMTPNVENLTLTGSDNVNGYGNELDNVLTGNSGVNTLAGGPGNDSYLVQSAADVVVEEPGGGTDTILVAFTYTLAAANVENLTLTGVANVNGTGNAFDNVITGNAGNNVLDGTGGTDTLAGGAGNDTYLLNDADPGTRLEIRGTTGSVFFFSLLAPPDSVSITASDSPSDGDTLVDTVAVNVNTAAPGQFANVVFSTRNLNEPLLEGLYTNAARWPFEGMQPGMQVFANGAGFNTLTGSFDVHAAEFDYSGPSPQVVSLSIDFDQLGDGGSHWTGGLRINIVSDSPVDTVVENANEGIDTIETPFGHTLPANVENLTLTGADDVDGTGNEIANVLAGNSGVNVLAGGAGNDTYVVQDANDEVVEQPNEGSDTIAAAFSITTLPANVENATLTGSANLDVTGNAGANVLTGNAGNNTLTGGAGNDTLNGDAGFDTAIYAGNRADYTLTFSRASGTITVGTAAEGLDTLAGVEVIQFADMAVVFDLNPAVSGRTDFNDNFSGDIVWRNANGALTQWLMNGASFGSEGEPLPGIGPGWTVLGTTDFQGDGKTDIALRHADGRLFFWLMNGATIVEGGSVISGGVVNTAPIHPAWRVVGASDFNGDGKGDLLFRHDEGRLSVWLMDGRNRLSIGLQDAGLSPLSKTLVGTGDFDGDGKGDILWRDDGGALSIWRMNGTTISQTVDVTGGESAGGTGWEVVGTGDANGDGRSDIVWRNPADGALGLWRMEGASVTLSGGIAAPGDWTGGDLIDWQVAEVNDYDGDGKHDLLLRKDDGTNAIWKLDGQTAVSSTILAGPAKGEEWAVVGQPLAADVTRGDALPNRLFGDNGEDVMRGLAGDDRLEGRGGDDTLIGGAGNDVMVGGPGSDTAVFGSLRSQATITVSEGVTTVVSSEGTDTLTEIEMLVFADDVPEVTVAGNRRNIDDGDASPGVADGTDFGAVFVGAAAVERTFTVANTGGVALATANLVLPAGYTLVEGLSGAIAAGTSDTFTVRLETDTPAVYGGSITFETNDANENPFEFAVSGTVAVPPATLLAIAATDAAKAEGNSGSTAFTFTVTRSGDTSGVTTVDWAAAGGANPAAVGADFVGGVLPSDTLAFDPGETQKAITVEVAGDLSYESGGAAESFVVTLANPSGDTGFTQASAAGGILNDDAVPPTPSLSGVADFNEDGSGDVIWRNADGTLALWLMNGSAFGSEVQPLPGIGPGWTVLGTTDFQGDGKTDIALRHADGRLFFWLMNGATIVEGGSVISGGVVNTAPIHPAWRVVGASDFNGDGKGDLLFRHDEGRLSVWLMDGRNRLSIGLQDAGLSPLSKTLVGTGDFDGDGKGDILWRDEAGQASLWRMNGTTIVTTNEGIVGPQFSGDTNWVVVGTGDADGDNRADVYWRNESDGRLGLWLSSASGELAAPGDWTGGDLINWQVADVNDYDGDGLHDLLLRKEDGTNAIWKLDALTAESSTILGGPAKGAQWAVAGQPLASDVTTGDALPNRLIGDLGADTMRGFAGEDRLDGRGGTDTLLGGEGDDVLVVGDGSFTLVDGGSGTDTFQFGGTNLALDFAAIANNRTAGIEAIDMTGSGNNTVRLNAADVLDFSNTSNSMTIIGDAGDAAQLAGGGWSAGAVSGGFRTYTSGQATLLVDTDIVVTVI